MNIFKAPTFNRLCESIEDYIANRTVKISIEKVNRTNGEMYWIAVMIVNAEADNTDTTFTVKDPDIENNYE